MTRFPNPQLAQQWRDRLGRFDRAELTIAEFCELEGYSTASFYQWRRKLRTGELQMAPAFVPVIAIAPTTRIFVYTAATDMRKGFCGLSGLVKEHFTIDLFSGHLFVFFNRKRDYVKILAWDNDGLSIWSKRLERGTFEKLVRCADGNFEIDSAELVMMLRGEDIFARAGMLIPRDTPFGMLANIATLVSPLVALMKSRIVSGRILGVDDTSVRMQDPSIPGKMLTARFWLYRGREDHPYNVFDFTESRGRDGSAGFLSDFYGHAVVDAYGVHDGVYLGAQDRIFAACCNCHARRKFVEAKPNDPVAAAQAMAMYRGLYDVEDRAKEASAAERLELRGRESVPLMNELRSLTIGRQNLLFVGSHRGGEVAAAMYSVVSSSA